MKKSALCRLPVFALALLLFAGQSLALQHIHVDEAPSADCVLCIHTDTTALLDTGGVSLRFADNGSLDAPLATCAGFEPFEPIHPARAPPHS